MRQALELALDWIQKQPEETPDSKYDVDTRYVVLRELEAALAQPEQEPVATDWSAVHEKLELVWYRELSADEGLDEVQDLINTTPPQRTWVDLTDDEMLMIYGQDHEGKKYNLGRMVQQALKEKNT